MIDLSKKIELGWTLEPKEDTSKKELSALSNILNADLSLPTREGVPLEKQHFFGIGEIAMTLSFILCLITCFVMMSTKIIRTIQEEDNAKNIINILYSVNLEQGQDVLNQDLQESKLIGNPTLKEVNHHFVYQVTLNKDQCLFFNKGFNSTNFKENYLDYTINNQPLYSEKDFKESDCQSENNLSLTSKLIPLEE
jgi:hypothetical protein